MSQNVTLSIIAQVKRAQPSVPGPESQCVFALHGDCGYNDTVKRRYWGSQW
jgi:hypothetical protein